MTHSDHVCVFFDILISVTTESRSVSVRKRRINENTSALLMKAIHQAFLQTLLIWINLTQKLRMLLMILRLWKSARRMADRNHLGENQQQFRVWKDNVEWMRQKTKLKIHYSIYKDNLHAFNVELATARQTFFSNLINSNLNNTRTLFATVERPTTPPPQVRFQWNALRQQKVCFLLFWEDQ